MTKETELKERKHEIVTYCDECGLKYITIGKSDNPKCVSPACKGNIVKLTSDSKPDQP